jgi:hypothetical protein
MHEAMRFRLVADDKGWVVHTAVKPTPGMEVEFTVMPIKQPQAERFCTISSLPWHECSYEEHMAEGGCRSQFIVPAISSRPHMEGRHFVDPAREPCSCKDGSCDVCYASYDARRESHEP